MRYKKAFIYFSLTAGVVTAVAIVIRGGKSAERLEINAGLCAVAPHVARSTHPDVTTLRFSAAGEARVFAALLNSRAPNSRSADVDGEWVMRGKIDNAAADSLRRRLTQLPAPARLRITSAGGDERAAIAMANEVSSHGLPVLVDTVCGSACANYLLAAAPRVHLEGIVLMHGSPAACAAALGTWRGLQTLGWRGLGLLHAAARRQRDFEDRHPWFKDLVERSASPDRGDPSGAKHLWRHVPAAEMMAAHPSLTAGGEHLKTLTAYQALQSLAPTLETYFP